ncbi:NUDIX hydrolase [Jatrophihabitans endophyticus]|uniref:NUDIX domain-containing protein n=1 Tax=Jatrophihabitans endophyticus TaxID=1206085 RepID=UPI0019E9C7EF|nr:NUDIX hydrolase [Jatrophihabitans endophyticus]MBE7186767.1 NUDIX hydrolase [Jatrophihabitans endophyticus]
MSDGDDYEVVDSETIFDGRIMSLRRDSVRMPEGTVSVREVVAHLGAVGVVALDGDGNVVLVNQYRHPVRARLDELPAGLLDVEGEPPLAAAKRELLEEAALVADDWNVLLDLHTSPGFSTESLRLYLARGLSSAPDRDGFEPEHEERTMTVRRVPLGEAVSRALAGHITNATAVAGLLAAIHGRATGWRDLRPADAPWPSRTGR